MKLHLLLLLGFICIESHQINAQSPNDYFNEVLKTAQLENKKLLLIFEGSDWCAPCIKLEKEIISTDEFQKLIADHYLILKADFPRSKKNKPSKEKQELNKMLADKYNTHGYFPLVVILNSHGYALGALDYKKTSPENFYHSIEQICHEN